MSDQFTSVQWSKLPLQQENNSESTDLLGSYDTTKSTEPVNAELNNDANSKPVHSELVHSEPVHSEPVDTNAEHNDVSEPTPTKDISQLHNVTIHVTNPELQTDGSNSFTIYHIQIKFNDTNKKDYEIERRYSDFDILHKGLTHNYPTLLIPPLPNKQRLEYIKGGRFTDEFVLKRCNSLDLFIQRLLNHKLLKDTPIFNQFLSSKLNIWNNCRIEISNLIIGNSNISNSKIDGFTEFLMNSFKKPHISSPNDLEFKEIINNKCKLQENLHKIDKIYTKILSKQSNIANELNNFSNEFNKLTILLNNDMNGKFRSENDLSISERNLISVFKKFSGNLKENSNEYLELNKFIEFNYLNNLKDLEHYILSIDSLIKLKDNKILDYEMLNKYLEKSIQESENLQNGGKLTSTTEGTISFLSKKLEFLTGKNNSLHDNTSLINERIEKLQNRINLLKNEKQISRQVLDKFESDLLNEWSIFQNIKNDEIINSLNLLSQSYLKFYENSYNQWNQFQIDSNLINNYESISNTESDVINLIKDQQIDKNQQEIEDTIRRLTT